MNLGEKALLYNYNSNPGICENRKRKATEAATAAASTISAATTSSHNTNGWKFPNFNGHVVTAKATKYTGNAVWDHYMTNYHDVPLGRFHIPMSPSAGTLESSTPLAVNSPSDSRDSWNSDLEMQSMDTNYSTTVDSSSGFPNFSPVHPSKYRRLHL